MIRCLNNYICCRNAKTWILLHKGMDRFRFDQLRKLQLEQHYLLCSNGGPNWVFEYGHIPTVGSLISLWSFKPFLLIDSNGVHETFHFTTMVDNAGFPDVSQCWLCSRNFAPHVNQINWDLNSFLEEKERRMQHCFPTPFCAFLIRLRVLTHPWARISARYIFNFRRLK